MIYLEFFAGMWVFATIFSGAFLTIAWLIWAVGHSVDPVKWPEESSGKISPMTEKFMHANRDKWGER